MKNKKYTAILLSIVMVLVFTACGNSTGSGTASENKESTAAVDAGDENAASESAAAAGTGDENAASESAAAADTGDENAASESTAAESASADESAALISTAAESASPAGEYKTFSDLFALGSGDYLQSITEDRIVYIFTIDNVSTRYEGVGTKEIYKAVDEIPLGAKDRDDRIQKLVGPVEITKTDALPAAPSEKEIKSLVGKTGQELIDAGYVFNSMSVDDGETTVLAVKNYGSYLFTFKGAVDEESSDWIDEAAKLTSTNAYYSGIDYSAIDNFKN